MADEKAIIGETKEEAQYDETAKMLLAQKPFLANILVRTVKDFMDMDSNEVEELIEGEPYISEIAVDPGFTNTTFSNEAKQITGMNNEDKVRKEGVLFYDILFFVRTPNGLSKVIVNIEAQKAEPTKYDVEMRGLFYAVREISSQLNREFSNQNYNEIKKVYSIWICMNEPENTLEKIYLTKEDIIGHSRWKDMYEIINVVIVRLGKTLDPKKDHGLHRLLGALFLPNMSVTEKNEVLEDEFHIEMEGDRKEMLKTMCNLSQGIKEQGIEQGIEQGRINEIFSSVQEGDYSVGRGAEKLHLSISEFEKQMTDAGYQIPTEV